MPVEIEIKLKVDDLSAVRERLKSLGAERVGEVVETNVFFDTSDRALMASDCGLRLRRNRRAGKTEKLVLTYKGPRAEGPVKRREEIEILVDSFDATVELLSRLGYTQNLSFEKRRETWKLEKATIELDTLPQLGHFVEIEARSEAQVLKLRDKLGLNDLESILTSYPDLVSHHLSERKPRQATLNF